MEHKDVEELLKRYLSGNCSAKERALLESWYAEEQQSFTLTEEELKADLAGLASELPLFKPAVKVPKTKLWPRIASVAAVLLLLGALALMFNVNRYAEFNLGSADIAPGKNTATLTLANGKTINLSDAKTGIIISAANDQAKLTYNDGSAIDSSASSSRQFLTAATPRGGQYTVTLPDGTKVWLNAASSIRFPSTFAHLDIRKVEVTGEVYFEVAKVFKPSSDQRMPFIVATSKQQVEVLGTHFNINSYDDEGSTKTTLLEGAVRILPSGTRLLPNQQSILRGQSLKVITVNPESVVAWKNNLFGFDSEEVGLIMRQVSRWYDVEVIYDDKVQSIRITGEVPRFTKLFTLLEKLEQTGLIKFSIKGRRVYVSKQD